MVDARGVVVVTGATSFVGMHLARRFSANGFRVIATVSRPIGSYVGIQARRLRELEPGVELVQLDVRDGRAVSALVDRTRPGLWLHHAGYATNYASPDYDMTLGFSVNVVPLSSIYAALAGGRCGIIITGSSAEYSASNVSDREADPCCPTTPYGLSKYSETLYASQLAQRHLVPTRVARLYIPFGRLDHPDKLLSQVVSGLMARNPIELSLCNQVRDFICITDVCDAYIALAHDMPRTRFDIFNVCSGEPARLRDVLLRIAERLGVPSELLRFGARPMREGEPPVSFGDNEKAQRILGWKGRGLTSGIDLDLLGQHPDELVAQAAAERNHHRVKHE